MEFALSAGSLAMGLVFRGMAEPISHDGTPPPGIAANTPEAAASAMRYSFFHRGLHPWAVCSVAPAIAFFSFRRGVREDWNEQRQHRELGRRMRDRVSR